jgi:hypothetical protein
MIFDYKKFITMLFALIVSLLMGFLMTRCSANYHFTKFIQKGGKIDTTERIVNVEKTIRVNGKDSLIVLKVPSVCPEVKMPPSRFERRIEYRLKRDTMRLIKFQTKWRVKEVVKIAKVENKSKWWVWLLVGFGIAQGLRLTWIVIQKRL